MGSQESIAKVPVYPVLIVVSFLVGYFIPGFYDWTGSDQSRPSPLVGKTAAGLLVGATLIWAILPWVPVADDAPGPQERRRIQFTSRTLLLLTTAIAIVLAVVTRFPMVVSGVLCALGVLPRCLVLDSVSFPSLANDGALGVPGLPFCLGPLP